jgi:putative hydrolase of the HAD superfamily
LPPRTLEQVVFASELSQRAQRGDLSEEVFWREIERELDLAQFNLSLVEFHREFFAGDCLDEELIALIRSLRPALKTGLISNAWSSLRRVLHTTFPVHDAFDTIVISAEEKIMKPDERIYRLALDRLDVRPHEAIFLDDFQVNIDAANALGIHGIHYRSTEQARHDIRMLLDGQ